MKNWSSYEMDEDNYSKLVDAYKGVFPGRFDTFEKLRRKSLDDVDFHIKEMKEKRKQQEKCDHEYDQPTMTIFGFYGKQCIKCMYIQRIKNKECGKT